MKVIHAYVVERRVPQREVDRRPGAVLAYVDRVLVPDNNLGQRVVGIPLVTAYWGGAEQTLDERNHNRLDVLKRRVPETTSGETSRGSSFVDVRRHALVFLARSPSTTDARLAKLHPQP